MAKNMKISIAERWRPYSHLPGSVVLLPLSTLKFQIYPALIRIEDLVDVPARKVKEIRIAHGGLVENFTILQDLEKGCLRVWGESPKGYFRYRLQAVAASKFLFIWERRPEGLEIDAHSELSNHIQTPPETTANLSFGIAKSQDWQLIDRRLNMGELLPIWFRLGQWTAPMLPTTTATAPQLPAIERALQAREPEIVLAKLRELYLTCFEGMLCPNLSKKHHLGIEHSEAHTTTPENPLTILTAGAELIRRMFIDADAGVVTILGCRPKELHCGRLINLTLTNVGTLDLEWSNKKIRRMLFRPSINGAVEFKFQSGINTYRLRSSITTAEHKLRCGELVDFSSKASYQFDHFA